MRIAQFSESFRPVINGVAVAVDLLLEEFSARHDLHVFAPHFAGYADPARQGVVIHRLPSYIWPTQRDYPLSYPFAPAHSARFRRSAMDVVHTHSPFTLGQMGRRWARRAGIPVVTTYHTLYVEYGHYAPFIPRGMTRWAMRELTRRYCNSVDAVVVPTDPIREVLLEYGVGTPINVIPTGLRIRAPEARDPAVRKRLSIPEDAVVVLYAGRLAREKNLGLLFDSFARAAREQPHARLLIAGSGPEELEARRQAQRAGLDGRVVFAGFQPPEEMGSIYAAADLFAFTSLTDTQGLVLTEAKAAGLPVVSVDAFGPSVVVKNDVDGLLRPPDPGALGQALARLIADSGERERMRANALREIRAFSIEATAAAYEAVYAQVRAGRGAVAGPSPVTGA